MIIPAPCLSRRLAPAFLALCVGPALALHAAKPAGPAPTPHQLERFALHAPRTPRTPAQADKVWPMRIGKAAYRVVHGEHSGRSGRLSLRSLNAQPSAERHTFRHARLDQHVERLRRDARGNLMLTRFEDVANDMIIRFDKPLTLIRATMQPGEKIVSRSPITVFDRADPTEVDNTGTCRFTVTYDAEQTLRVPAGRFQVRRFKVECEADVGAGGFTSTAYYYFADGVGLIAETYVQSVSFFIFSRDFRRAIVRLEPPRCRAYLAAHPEG